jgi:hypothetical protein
MNPKPPRAFDSESTAAAIGGAPLEVMTERWKIRPAEAEDRAAVGAILLAASLPLEGSTSVSPTS